MSPARRAHRRAVVLLLLLPWPALAAVPSPEILVTARKYEERLQSVPVAVSVLDAGAMQALDVTRLEDIARLTPGFSFDTSVGRQPASYRPVIRGLTTVRNGIANASSAATFIDGVYVGGSTQSTELYNLERIEVLRGPQTALYGRNTYAGAINYVTRAPSATFEGEAILTGGGHETREAGGWVSGPLGDPRLRGFLAAGHREYGGEYVNRRDGTTVGSEETRDVTAKLWWQPNEQWSLMLRGGLQFTDDGHYPTALQPGSWNNCCFRTEEAPRARGYFKGRARTPDDVLLYTDLLEAAGGAGAELERSLVSLDVRWAVLPGQQLRSITGWIDDRLDRGIDLSYAAYDPVPVQRGSFLRRDRIEQADLSQELQWSGGVGGRLRWLVGAYAYDGRYEFRRAERVYEEAGALVVAPNFGPLTRDEVDNRALFGGVEADLGARWTAGIELRWSRDEIRVENRANDGSGVLLEHFERDFDSLSPRLTAAFRVDEDMTWYGNVARGTRPGDFNARVPDESLRAVDEEEVWSYEIGVRGFARGAGLRYALAAFYNDVRDQQLTSLVELDDDTTASIVLNVGRTAIYGIEAEWTLALSDSVTLDGNYAWTHAEYRRHLSPEEADLRGSDGSIEDLAALGDVSGNRLPRVADHMAALALRHERAVSAGLDGFLAADWSFESSRYAQEHNLIETGNRHLVGLRAGLDGGRWDLTLWARNLLDDDTPVDILRYFDARGTPLTNYPQVGPRPSRSARGFAIGLPRGRQFGATLRMRF